MSQFFYSCSPMMEITYCGHAMLTILRDLIGQTMTEAFELIRPLIAFSFNTVQSRMCILWPVWPNVQNSSSFHNDGSSRLGITQFVACGTCFGHCVADYNVCKHSIGLL